MSEGRRFSEASERNRQPILNHLLRVLPSSGRVIEIASGTGMHASWFAPRLPGIAWQPTDYDATALQSIRAWRDHLTKDGVPPFEEPVHLDVTTEWPFDAAAAVYCANMIHISPWEATLGLLDGASAVLGAGGPLVLYGPYLQDDVETAPSNLRFDGWLRARDPRFGIRRLETVAEEAGARGLVLDEVVEMPANNLIVVFRRG